MRYAALLPFLLLASTPRADAGTLWTWGARVSSPQLFSVSGGVVIGRLDAPERPAGADAAAAPSQHMYIPRGLLLQVEPGIGGGKVGLGFVKGLPPVAAAGVQAFLLRTWGQPLWNETGRSYAGVELDATLFLKLSVGVMKRVDGGRRETKVTGGIGVGF